MLAGAALSHLKFAHRRRGRALVRVLNPTLKEHGYYLTAHRHRDGDDDMPFLVDSIASRFHNVFDHPFLAHPIFSLRAMLRHCAASRSGPSDRSAPPARVVPAREIDRISTRRSSSHCAPTSSAACATCGSPLRWAKMSRRRAHADDLNLLHARLDARDRSEPGAMSWMRSVISLPRCKEYRLRVRARAGCARSREKPAPNPAHQSQVRAVRRDRIRRQAARAIWCSSRRRTC